MTEFPVLPIVVISGATDAAVALTLLLISPLRDRTVAGPSVGLGSVAGAVAATMVFFALKALFLGAIGLNPFGLIHLIYFDLVVVVPMLGLTLLILSYRTRRAGPTRFLSRPVLALALASLGLPPIGFYATFWEPFNLRVESATVPVAARRAGTTPLRIGVLTDLQTRRVSGYERGAIDRLMALRPDLILIPGDVFQGPDDVFEREGAALRELLAKLDAPGGVFLVPGDVDQGAGRVASLVEGTRIVALVNEIVRVEVGDRRLTIGGVELRYSSAAARKLVDRLEQAPGSDDVRILLAHRPDVVLGMKSSSRVDLVVAGHTHGGQIVVPGFGPPMTLSSVPRPVAAGGLHRLDGNRIYVSRGVGCERGQAPRIRFFCPPELSILTVEGLLGFSMTLQDARVDNRKFMPIIFAD